MELRIPRPDEAQFVTVVDDVDDVEIEVVFHKDQAAAEKHLKEQFDGIPDTEEPDGLRYDNSERPNASISFCRVVLARVLRRTLL